MSAPKRIQRKRTKGWRMPEGALYVGRPTKWGNPFAYRSHSGLARVPGANDPDAAWEYEGRCSADGAQHDYFHPDGRITRHQVRFMTRAECVETFRRAVTEDDSPSMRMAFPNGLGKWLGRWVNGQRVYVTAETIRAELAGRDLACWCPLDQPCHADVLLELANGERS